MPFPTTVSVSLIVKAPATARERLIERLAAELHRIGIRKVSTGHALVRFDTTLRQGGSRLEGEPSGLLASGEIEILDRGDAIELVAEMDVGRLPLAFGTATLIAATLTGGLHTFSLIGGLLGGAAVAVVPWIVGKVRVTALLKRVARELTAGPAMFPPPEP